MAVAMVPGRKVKKFPVSTIASKPTVCGPYKPNVQI
jgi:hypothetical protein